MYNLQCFPGKRYRLMGRLEYRKKNFCVLKKYCKTKVFINCNLLLNVYLFLYNKRAFYVFKICFFVNFKII